MPRANRHYLPGQFWHITHRCHEKTFLLKFARDRRRYRHWLFEARKRFGLCILNYVVTSNHIHLLVKDTGTNVIAQSLQLIAGCTAQEYNRRKQRQGAFWEDRYHATAIEGDAHLHRCIVYIDLNMVRAGVVRHPADWLHGGYREIQTPPDRYSLIDLKSLATVCGFRRANDFQLAHRAWVEEALQLNTMQRDAHWTESLAVGTQPFVENVKRELGLKARHRGIAEDQGSLVLRQTRPAYAMVFDGENEALRGKNGFKLSKNVLNTWGWRGPTP